MAVSTVEYPQAADLYKDVYRPLPSIPFPQEITDDEAGTVCLQIVKDLEAALVSSNESNLKNCFYEPQAYWTDLLALTWHLRSIRGHQPVVHALKYMSQLRQITDLAMILGSSNVVKASPNLSWLACRFTFRTRKPLGSCCGKLMILPQTNPNGSTDWKIWILGTWLQDLMEFPQDRTLLDMPLPNQETNNHIKTSALIIGGGNSGICLAARLKALGVCHLVVEKNTRVGDNWRNRYDNMKFHLEKNLVSLPFAPYPDEDPIYLTREHLADHLETFAQRLQLNVRLSTTVTATKYDEDSQTWQIKLNTPHGTQLVFCKQLVLATGAGCQVPWKPPVDNAEKYKGISLHSVEFKSAKLLKQQGARSALVIGSANTGFDVMNDCYKAGLKTTMVQRAPTYLIPDTYLVGPPKAPDDPDTEDAARAATPLAVSGQLLKNVFMGLAASEPDRYQRLSETGFQVKTDGDVTWHLLVRGGGHYVDFEGGTLPVASGAVGIKSGVVPTAFTSSGLQFSDGTHLDADAVIWCTGFADLNMRDAVPDILGAGGDYVASKMDMVWGLDKEGQIRGAWKQQKNLPNFWVMCGTAPHHRYQSKLLAMQIKMAVEGRLPVAYRDGA
ncbi:hypothetical protein F4775DRAFT_558367 [Biscogniauxia sp. FL1348]|nr:hypothetical protein F4775DRAFT_558367 [Biscogniauxia sp. FL1348]